MGSAFELCVGKRFGSFETNLYWQYACHTKHIQYTVSVACTVAVAKLFFCIIAVTLYKNCFFVLYQLWLHFFISLLEQQKPMSLFWISLWIFFLLLLDHQKVTKTNVAITDITLDFFFIALRSSKTNVALLDITLDFFLYCS